ncbi:hypothetical protein [Xenorhabdus sp. SGI240]|uniref:hypothetical protein n=1 Tax=Xenorhabdus sp. SGI240 TaxID=3158262 RepID=UPI0032B87834
MVIALDFDGVIVDSIDECLLVSWNVINGNGHQQFSKDTLKSIPPDFIKSFRNYRCYMRHDGHFIVPYYLKDSDIETKSSFEKIYSKIPQIDKDNFRNMFREYRNNVRDIYPEIWTSLHKFLVDINDILKITNTISIVSGKDLGSIHFLLRRMGIEFPASKIYGGMTSKFELLKTIQNEARIQKK